MVRTPRKLTDLLEKRGLKKDVIQSKLVILQGNARDKDVVQKVLVDDTGKVAEQIVFGIGMCLLTIKIHFLTLYR